MVTEGGSMVLGDIVPRDIVLESMVKSGYGPLGYSSTPGRQANRYLRKHYLPTTPLIGVG